jgi:hypothetical protein
MTLRSPAVPVRAGLAVDVPISFRSRGRAAADRRPDASLRAPRGVQVPDQLYAPAASARDGQADAVREYRVHGNRVQDTGSRPVLPPPRPPVASRLPTPGSVAPPPRPWILTVALGLWVLFVVAGLVALITSAIDLEDLRRGLLSEAHVDDRDATEQELANGVVVTLATIALLCDAALLLAVWGLRLAARRSTATARVLVVAAVLALPAVGIAQGMVGGGATDLDRQAFLVQAALVLPAMAALLARPSRAWLRRETD